MGMGGRELYGNGRESCMGMVGRVVWEWEGELYGNGRESCMGMGGRVVWEW